MSSLVLSGCGSKGTSPSITLAPSSQTVISGQAAVFSVEASGTGPLAYQWFRGGAAVAGATSSSYTVTSTTLADSGAVFNVTVTNPGGTARSSDAVLTVSPMVPALALAQVGAKTFGAAPFGVAATSNSPGAITYAVVSGPATISGSVVSLTGAGTVVLSATQSTVGEFASATATTTFTVAPATPALAFAPVPAKSFGDAAFAVSASSASTGAVSYAVVSGPATVAGSTVTLTGAGTVVLSASQVGDSNYVAATATTTFSVTPGKPALAFAAIPAKAYGDASFIVSASSASTGAVTYAVVSGPATVSGSTVTIAGAGTVVLSATQAADANYENATASTTFTVSPAPATTAALSVTSFDFGQTLVGSPATKQVVTVTNTGAATLYFGPSLAGDASYSLPSAQGCGAALAGGASCAVSVVYGPTASSGGATQTATLNLNFENAASSAGTVTLTGISGVLTGTVTSTNHPQVAMYSIQLPFAGSVTVNFGPTTAYGRQTWTKTLSAPGTVNMLVAGMLENSTYHMQASVQFADGSTALDTDHTFTTGSPPFPIVVSTETPAGLVPQPGVEQLSIWGGAFYELVVTDLQGRRLWSYQIPGDYGGYDLEGAKLMSNGDFLVTLGQGSSFPLANVSATNIVMIREIDLAGNTVREISAATLSQKLQDAGYNIALQQFHHDVVPMANGHWLVLGNELRNFTNLTGIPGTTKVLGDVVVDLDENLNPVWVWDEFDHLDVNRHPWMFPDWTHTNAVVYSKDDGNLIISMRHQNWVVKVDYRDGQGTGNVLWKLGEGGDFTLLNGTDPTDWNYAQHFPSFFSPNTSGVFSLGMMNNGDDREFPTGTQCGVDPAPPCLYTSIPVFQIDENAKTATLIYKQDLPASLYSFFGGNTDLLANGDVEYDLAGTNTTMADIFETTMTSSPQTVWHMHSGTNVYRGYRIPSLYPGVQW